MGRIWIQMALGITVQIVVILMQMGMLNAETSDTESTTPEIYLLHIRSDIAFRFATTNVTSQIANRADESRQVTFLVTLPKAAFITYFEMIIDDKTYPGSVKEKEVAKREYEKAKKKGQSAGHVSKERDTGTFKVSVNVAARSKVFFHLTYQELLQRRLGVYQHVITIKPGQVVRDLKVDVYIKESRNIVALKVPELRTDYSNSLDAGENALAVTQRINPTYVHVSYSPTPAQQIEITEAGVAGQFIVEYDVQRDLDAGEIQVVDGYFVHYFAPSGLPAVDKNVLFVLDTSGSMGGIKLQQLKEAMKVIINDLRPNDKFAILPFSSSQKEAYGQQSGPGEGSEGNVLFLATPDNKKAATEFIYSLGAHGGTNINDAVVQGVNYLIREEDKYTLRDGTRSSIIIFLTDGEPTSGVTDVTQIAKNIQAANGEKVAIFSLGFGKGVKFSLLQKISLQNNGIARKIYEDADASLQLQGFYNEVATPTLKDVKIKYLEDTVESNQVTDSKFPNYFNGSEFIIAGKLKDNEVRYLETKITGHASDRYMELNLEPVNVQRSESLLKRSELSKFTERLWAYLTIRKLLDSMKISQNATEIEEIKAKALDLSLKYSFVTPLTSMVVTKPEEPVEEVEEENEDAEDSKRKKLQSVPQLDRNKQKHHGRAPGRLSSPGRSRSSGRGGFVDNDPHFIVSLDGLQENVCFDVDGELDQVFRLLHDKKTGIFVNGKITRAKKAKEGAKKIRTYIGQLAVLSSHHKQLRLVVTPHSININGMHYSWKESEDLTVNHVNISIVKHVKINVYMSHDVVFTILRHVSRIKADFKVDYLGFYVKQIGGLSTQTHGLIGQFLHQSATLTQQTIAETASKGQQSRGTILLSRDQHMKQVEATMGFRENMEIRTKVPCWFVHNNGKGLLDGSHTDYIVPKITSICDTKIDTVGEQKNVLV